MPNEGMRNGKQKQLHGRPRVEIPHWRVRTSIKNGGRILDGIDGRTMIARRYREVGNAMAQDLGGADELTEAKLHLVRTAAGLVVLRERLDTRAVNDQHADVAEYCRISNSLARVLRVVGIDRIARVVNPTVMSKIIENIRDP